MTNWQRLIAIWKAGASLMVFLPIAAAWILVPLAVYIGPLCLFAAAVLTFVLEWGISWILPELGADLRMHRLATFGFLGFGILIPIACGSDKKGMEDTFRETLRKLQDITKGSN